MKLGTRHLAARGLPVHALLPGVALAALVMLRPWMEGTMGRHMGLELPLLFLIGCWGGSAMGMRTARRIERWNAHGLPGLLAVQCVMAFWMLPVALDAAVLDPRIAVVKVASLLIAGVVGYLSWRLAGPIIQTFFILNGSWMMLTAGLLYQTAPQQLCSVYLADEQASAGSAMVAWAVFALLAWLQGLLRRAVAAD
jgi:hypothetical protein